MPYSNGKKHGTEIRYYREGKENGRITKKQWKEGVSLSDKGYYPSGELWFECLYVDGRRHGMQKIYYESGSMKEKAQYFNDERNGLRKIYSSSGRLIEEIPYKMGKISGIRKTYGEGGEVKETFYEDGREVPREVHSVSPGDTLASPQVQLTEEVVGTRKEEKTTRVNVLLLIAGIVLTLGGVIYAFRLVKSRKT